MGNKEFKVNGLSRDSHLIKAQDMQVTSSGFQVNNQPNAHIMTRRELEKMRRKTLPRDISIVLNPPFSNIDRILDSLYLTGIGGLLEESLRELKITCIINATYEMPLAKLSGVHTLRVPVSDDVEEDILT